MANRMNGWHRGLPGLLGVLAVGGLLCEAQPASATNNCMQDTWKLGGHSQSLGCTANDVKVAYADNIRGLNGNPITMCNQGATFSFFADFHLALNATSRSNIGLYFATDGDSNGDGALTGMCSDNVITPVRPSVPASAGEDSDDR